MPGGELSAAFEGLAADAGQAGGDIAESIAGFTEDTANIEDANVARTLAADSDAAQAAAAVRPDPGDLPPGLTGTGGWTGARYVESSSPEEEAAYAAIRASTGDVPEIADNTGISPDVIAQVKDHLFLTEHDVPIGPGEVVHGYFTPDGEVASLWAKAEDGTLSPAELSSFRSLMAHEYVESRLMEAGLPYRSADPEAWEDGEALFNPSHFGAHEVAPIASDGTLRQWPALGLTPPDVPIASDLSNINEVVSAALRGLGLLNAQNHAAGTLARLLAVDWTGQASFDHARSRARLMREYLRRAARWAEALDATGEWPFFDIAGLLAPQVRSPEDLSRELDALIYERIGWPSVADSCRAVLRWAALLDAGVPGPDRLEDPFEPLLLLFERGGGWTTESGFIELDGSSVRRRTWQDHLTAEPLVSLTEPALDALDAA